MISRPGSPKERPKRIGVVYFRACATIIEHELIDIEITSCEGLKIVLARFHLGWCLPVLSRAAREWSRHSSQMAAALAFYTVFTIAPVLVIALNLIGWALGREAARDRLETQIEQYVGQDTASAIQSMIVAISQPQSGLLATSLSWVALVFGASGMFLQMQEALNATWDVPPNPQRGIWRLVRERLLAFLMVFVIAGLVLSLVVINGILTTLSQYASTAFPQFLAVARPLNEIGSIVILTLLFSAIFKIMPEVSVAWKDVWFGGLVTALLFTVGKYAIGYYLTTAAINSAYGAAGSVAVILLWAYYSAQILFFGAEVSQSYSREPGSTYRGDSSLS